jgi:hypothetical protein
VPAGDTAGSAAPLIQRRQSCYQRVEQIVRERTRAADSDSRARQQLGPLAPPGVGLLSRQPAATRERSEAGVWVDLERRRDADGAQSRERAEAGLHP